MTRLDFGLIMCGLFCVSMPNADLKVCHTFVALPQALMLVIEYIEE